MGQVYCTYHPTFNADRQAEGEGSFRCSDNTDHSGRELSFSNSAGPVDWNDVRLDDGEETACEKTLHHGYGLFFEKQDWATYDCTYNF